MTLRAKIMSGLAETGPVDLAIRATLLVFLLGPNLLGLEWYYQLGFQVVAIVGLIIPAIGASPGFWCVIAVMMVFKTLDHWWMQDNHVFLLTWWTIAMATAAWSKQRERIVSVNARWLIGLSFLLATLWKAILSPDYMSGDYFHYTFLTDARFASIGQLVGGMTEHDYQQNHAAFNRTVSYRVDEPTADLFSTQRLRTLTLIVTWWTVIIEGVLALLFLLPRRFRLSRYRHAALLLFAWTTYMAAPVKTFGWTLTTLGLAQCEREQKWYRIGYLLTYPLLIIYEKAPIWQTLNDWFAA